MVSNGDRGQVILVGAVLIAILIVGMVVASNSTLYTQNIDKGGAAESGREAAEFQNEVRRDARSVVIRVNHRRRYADQSDLEGAIRRNLSTYARALRETYVDSRSTFVNVSFDLGSPATTYGARVIQDADGTFVNPATASNDWAVVETAPGSRSDVGWLVVNLNTSQLSRSNAFEIRLTNDTGEFYTVSFRRNTSGYIIMTWNFSAPHAANGTAACAPTNGRLLVDILAGSVFGRDTCTAPGEGPVAIDAYFNATGYLAPPYGVEFLNAAAAVGKYELVVERRGSLNGPAFTATDHCTTGTTTTDDCWMEALWTVDVTAVYRSSRIQYRRSWQLEVYNGTHGP